MTSSAVVGSSNRMTVRPAAEGRGDDDALLFAAGDLVRIAAHHRGRIAQSDMAEQLDRERIGLARATARDAAPALP